MPTPWFGPKKVQPEDEEKEPGGKHDNDGSNPETSKKGKEAVTPSSKDDGKKDQFIDAADQAFATSVGVDTSGNLSETKANSPLQNEGSNAELGSASTYPDPRDIYHDEDRPVWDSRFDFLISMIGFALDVSNVWRFPWLCFKHRGLIFLLPYVIVLVLCAFPILYLELIIGQYVRKGVIGIWKICPLFKGVGYATLLITYSVVYTYNVALTWTLHFAIESWRDPIPWSTCDNEWNTKECIEINEFMEQTQRNGTLSGYEYFHGEALQRYDPITNTSYSIVNLGAPVSKNYIYLTLIYFLLVIFLIRGMKNTVKVMWYATGVTFVILTIMVFRGLTLPGSVKGLKFLVEASSFAKLADAEMWVDAASQVVYSTGLGFGVHLTFASLNRFHHYILRDCIIVLTFNVIASCISLVVVFGFIGSQAFLLRREVADTDFSGVETIFDLFPDALARLPANKFFAFCFFAMLFMLSFSSVLAAFQVVIMGLKDELRNDKNTTAGCKMCVLTALAVGASYGFGLVSLTQGGYDIFTTIDDNVATSSLLLCTFLHLIGISWFYGIDNVCRAVHAMCGSVPNICLRICWKFISPLILLALIVGDILYSSRYTDPGTPRVLRVALGAAITWFPMLVLLLITWGVFCRMKDPAKNICLISPALEHDEIRKVGKGYRSFKKHWKFIGTKEEIAEISGGAPRPKVELNPPEDISKENKPLQPEEAKNSKEGDDAVQPLLAKQPGRKGSPAVSKASRVSGVASKRSKRSDQIRNAQLGGNKRKLSGAGATKSVAKALSSNSRESNTSLSKLSPPKT